MVEQWAYARQDTMTRELFQAPRTGTPQHWDDFRYCQARHTRQWVLDLRNTRHEVESQLLSHHLYVIWSQNLNGLALEQAWDKVMRIYGRHLETEVEPFWDYLQAIQPEDRWVRHPWREWNRVQLRTRNPVDRRGIPPIALQTAKTLVRLQDLGWFIPFHCTLPSTNDGVSSPEYE